MFDTASLNFCIFFIFLNKSLECKYSYLNFCVSFLFLKTSWECTHFSGRGQSPIWKSAYILSSCKEGLRPVFVFFCMSSCDFFCHVAQNLSIQIMQSCCSIILWGALCDYILEGTDTWLKSFPEISKPVTWGLARRKVITKINMFHLIVLS